jgi:diadenosine tetraphosphate (Ap4A) HIT family hydrolase
MARVKHLNCPFCNPLAEEIVTKNDLCYALWARFPVSKGHILVITFRHAPSFFSTTDAERTATVDLVNECKKIIENNFRPVGYYIGWRYKKETAEDKAVIHSHCHVIPRYSRDVPDPKDGVMEIVPAKREY